MPVQTSIAAAPAIGKSGMLADSGYHDVLSGIMGSRKLYSVVVTAANSAVYTITINSIPYVYTADGSATTAEIVAGLVALINAGTEPVHAVGTDTPFTIESTLDGAEGDFTYSDGTSGGGTIVETLLVAQSQAARVGTYVVQDERRTLGPVDYAVRSPRLAADITGGLGLGLIIEEFALEQLPVSAAAFGTTLVNAGNTVVNVLHEGRAYVAVENAVTKGGAVYARFATGAGGSVLGALRGGTDDSATAAIIPRAKFLTSALAGGIAIVEFVR